MFGITGGYHRYFAHRSYKTSRVFQFVLAWLGCSALQKGPLWWAAHHREHHRYSDTPERSRIRRTKPASGGRTSAGFSPSDHVETPWETIQDLAPLPRAALAGPQPLGPRRRAGRAVLLLSLHRRLEPELLVWGFVVSTMLVYHATFTINSLSHLFGKRRYATTDDSRNNFCLALITLGEGWHNNHHHYQSSANQGFFWWEIDISYYTICLFRCFGLVWDLRKPGAKALAHRLIKLAPEATPLEQVAAAAAAPGPTV